MTLMWINVYIDRKYTIDLQRKLIGYLYKNLNAYKNNEFA